jgi:hypothetical protein
MIQITRKSGLTGKIRTLELPITQDQLDRWERGEDLIQNIMPELTPFQREFIMTGSTEEEWDETFKEDE